MNFGKKYARNKKQNLEKSVPAINHSHGFSFLRVFFLAVCACAVICICLLAGIYRAMIDSAPDISDVNIMPSGYATFVYDSDGNELQKLTSSSSNRMSVSIDKIPEDMQHAMVAIEDERFYEHAGIDARGILRAFVKGVVNGFSFDEGASTLTQQLLKNNVFTNWTHEGKIERFKRKFQEQYLALKLEESLTARGEDTKSVILENYLNTINFGAGSYGVQAAAKRYFNKDIEYLSLSECAVLAAIPQNPTKYNPINNPSDNDERRRKVLLNMRDQEYISESEYQEALNDDVYARIQEMDSSQAEEETPYSYFIDELIEQVAEDLQVQKGYTEVQTYNALYSGGLRIYTTQDMSIQRICDEEYSDPANFPANSKVGMDWAFSVQDSDGNTQHYSVEMLRLFFRNMDPEFELLFNSAEDAQAYIDLYKESILKEGDTVLAERTIFSPQPQSSLTIIDQKTGYVKALVGGRGEKTASLTLNRATNTYRQPGSTFKVLSTYAPALDSGMTLATTFLDAPYNYEDGTAVRNWLNDSYHGETTIRYAIQESVNVVAVKCLTEITPQVGFDYLQNFGFSRLVESESINDQIFTDIAQPLALGGVTYGVSNMELAAAYAAIANGGTYIKPMFYTRIEDQNGKVILDGTAQTTKVTKESTAYLLTSAMEDVVQKGTGTNLQLDNRIPVAGKTGTTSNYNDVWFAGFTPYYTCAVWAGYDNNEKLSPDGIERNFHQTLWKKIMNRIHEDLESDAEFEQPSDVTETTVCSISGKLPSSSCPTTKEIMDRSSIPTERCTSHERTDENISSLHAYDGNGSMNNSSSGSSYRDYSDENNYSNSSSRYNDYDSEDDNSSGSSRYNDDDDDDFVVNKDDNYSDYSDNSDDDDDSDDWDSGDDDE